MKQVLIVDDQSDIRRLISLTLANRYTVLEAADAGSAFEIIRTKRPDAVLLDVMMPGEMDGYQLCSRIKQDAELRHIHVILVTARGQVGDQDKGKAVGADGYFIKPFSPLSLVLHLDEALA